MLFLFLIATCMLATNAQLAGQQPPFNQFPYGTCDSPAAVPLSCGSVSQCGAASWLLPSLSSCGCYCNGGTPTATGFYAFTQPNAPNNGWGCAVQNITLSSSIKNPPLTMTGPYQGNGFFMSYLASTNSARMQDNNFPLNLTITPTYVINANLAYYCVLFAYNISNGTSITVKFIPTSSSGSILAVTTVLSTTAPSGPIVSNQITWSISKTINPLPALTAKADWDIVAGAASVPFALIDSLSVYTFTSACLGLPPFPIGQTNASFCNSTYSYKGSTCLLTCLPSYVNAGGNFTAVCNTTWTTSALVNNNWVIGTGSCIPTNSESHSVSHHSHSHASPSHESRSHSISHKSKSASHKSRSHMSHSHQSKSYSHNSESHSYSLPEYDRKPVNLVVNGGCEDAVSTCSDTISCGGCTGWWNLSTSSECGTYCVNGTEPTVGDFYGWNNTGYANMGMGCVYQSLPLSIDASGAACSALSAGLKKIGNPHKGTGFFSASIGNTSYVSLIQPNPIYATASQLIPIPNTIPNDAVDSGFVYFYMSAAYASETCSLIQIVYTLYDQYDNTINPVNIAGVYGPYENGVNITGTLAQLSGVFGNLFSPIAWRVATLSGIVPSTTRVFNMSVAGQVQWGCDYPGIMAVADDITLYVYTSACIGYPQYIPADQTYSADCNSSYTQKGGICTLQCLPSYMPSGGNFTAVCNSTWTNASMIDNNWILGTGTCVPTSSESHSHHSVSRYSESRSYSKSSSFESKSHSRSDSVSMSSAKCSSISYGPRTDVYAFNNHSIVQGTGDVPICPVQMEVSLTSAYNAFAGVTLSPLNVTVNGDAYIVNVTAQIVLYLTEFHQQLAANFSSVDQAITPAILFVNGCNQYQQVSSVSRASTIRYLDVPAWRDFTTWCRQSYDSKLPLTPYFQYDVVFPNLALPSALTASRQNQTALAIVMKGLFHEDSFFIDGISVGYSDGTIVTIPTVSCDSYLLDTFQCQCTNYNSCDLSFVTSPIMFDNGEVLKPV